MSSFAPNMELRGNSLADTHAMTVLSAPGVPIITGIDPDAPIVTGSDVHLECSATSGNPDQTVASQY